MNWNAGGGGGGAIDLVIHLHHLDFKAARRLAGAPFSGSLPPPPLAACHRHASPVSSCGCRPRSRQLARVKDYLARQRGLPQRCSIRSSSQAPCMPTPEPTPSSCCSEKKTSRWGPNCAAPPRSGVAWRPAPKKTWAASPFPPTPLCQSTSSFVNRPSTPSVALPSIPDHRCLSTAGARPNPRWLQPLLDQGCQVYCGFDADPTGDHMARAMIALHPAVQRLRPSTTTGTTCSGTSIVRRAGPPPLRRSSRPAPLLGKSHYLERRTIAPRSQPMDQFQLQAGSDRVLPSAIG